MFKISANRRDFDLSDADVERARDLYETEGKIPAVRVFINTGYGLIDAKAIVERLAELQKWVLSQ